MEFDELLYNLHFAIDKVRPPDAYVDWADAPLPFKLYQGLPTTPLPAGVSVTPRLTDCADMNLVAMGELLRYSYGIHQMCHVRMPSEDGEWAEDMQLLRRFVPSGGGLYPSELYAYLKLEGVTPGVYHYDVAHHRLVLLREGNFDAYLERALGHRHNLGSCFGTLFVSTMFWKNFFKYDQFAYRLQGLDAGVLMGQVLEVSKRMGVATRVCYQFLDEAIHHLLGLRADEEAVYAVIPLGLEEGSIAMDTALSNPSQPIETVGVLCKDWPALGHRYVQKSKRKRDYGALLNINEASKFRSTAGFTKLTVCHTLNDSKHGERFPLPEAPPGEYDFLAACKARYSPGLDFVSHRVSLEELATLLQHACASFPYANDLEAEDSEVGSRISIVLCAYGVNGLPDGAYHYDAKAHALRILRVGDHRMALQMSLSMPTVNFFQVPMCLHLVGPSTHLRETFGYRGYRICQMEIGIVLQKLLLTASWLGTGGHPLLGYDEGVSDEIHGFEGSGQTCLIQVPIGFYRKTSRLEGPIYP